MTIAGKNQSESFGVLAGRDAQQLPEPKPAVALPELNQQNVERQAARPAACQQRRIQQVERVVACVIPLLHPCPKFFERFANACRSHSETQGFSERSPLRRPLRGSSK